MSAYGQDDTLILVTGGAGFIGRRLAQRLCAEGRHVRVLDSFSTQVHTLGPRSAGADGFETLVGDVRDRAAVEAALDDVTGVVHLAAETGVGQSMYEIERYVSTNEGGTGTLLQAISERSSKVRRLVLASTRAVYGEGSYDCARCGVVTPPARAGGPKPGWDPLCAYCRNPITARATAETARPAPGSVYAATKLGQEHLVQTVGAAYDVATVILRYFNVYGPGQSLANPYTGILGTFYNRAARGVAIDVYEDGLMSRDFVYVDDVVEATVRALDESAENVDGQIFNVGSGEAVSVLALAEMVRDLAGGRSPIMVTGAYRVGDVRHAWAETSRAADRLGIGAPVALEKGLRSWFDWAEGEQVTDRSVGAHEELQSHGLYRLGIASR